MCVPPVGTHSASGLLTALCQQTAALDCAGSARHTTRPSGCAQVAQLAEQGTENPRVGGSIPPLGTNRQDRSELPAVPRAGFDVRSGGLVRTGLSALLPQRCTSPESSWHGSFLPNALACSALFGPADCCMCGHWTLRRGEHVATDHRKWIGAGAERRLLKGRRRVQDRKSTRLNSSHVAISYAVFCLKKKKKKNNISNTIKNYIYN